MKRRRINMNLYLRELNRNKKGLIIWSLIVVVLLIMMMSLFPTMVEQAETYQKVLEGMPEAFSSMFGLDKISMSDLFGYYSVEGYLFVTLLGGIYAVILSSGILSKEEGDKTIEFLLSKPITRVGIVTSKLLSYLTNLLIFNIIITLTMFFTFQAVKTEPLDMKLFWLLSIGPILLQLTFSSIGFLISVFITKTKKVLPISLGLVLITYFFSMISAISDKMTGLRYFSPFKYVDAADIITNGKIESKYLIIMLIVNALAIGLTYLFYSKKDITI